MKKIYLLCVATCLSATVTNAQNLILTRAINDPAIGDVQTLVDYDTITAVPRSTGLNKTWDMSAMSQSTVGAMSNSFIATSAATGANLFPSANIAAGQSDGGAYLFYKSGATQMELLGLYLPGGTVTFTNTQVNMVWPFTYGDSFSDAFSGSMNFSSMTVGISGQIQTNATGTGNLILPGGAFYTNVLQLTMVETSTLSYAVPIPTTSVSRTINYAYYHASNKYPLVSISYNEAGEAAVNVNNMVAVGLTDYNFDATFAIYPNPAKNNFTVKLSNSENRDCRITIYSATGQLVKQCDLGRDQAIQTQVPIQDLAPGIYMVKTILGGKSSSRRLVVE